MTETKLPNWTRDELILVLDLYFRINVKASKETNPDVIALSERLRTAHIHASGPEHVAFRNPSGVYTKLSKFLAYDSNGTGKGLPNPSELQKEVWSDFAEDKARLITTANSIRAWIEASDKTYQPFQPEDDDMEEAAEGRILSRLHQIRERNRELVEKKKRKVLESLGKLECEVCGFDFKNSYGDLGAGFIECHHRAPLSTLQQGQKTTLADLALVCANCHRMLHRGRRWLSVEELKLLIQKAPTMLGITIPKVGDHQ